MAANTSKERAETARRSAEQRFRKDTQRIDQVRNALDDLDKQHQADAAKTERLRALRLAKEAAERAPAEAPFAAKPAATASDVLTRPARRPPAGSN